MKDLDGLLSECRSLLDEVDTSQTPYWSDRELIRWLNEGAKWVNRAGQFIRIGLPFNTALDANNNPYQEYALKINPVDVIQVRFFDGKLLRPLVGPIDKYEVQRGYRWQTTICTHFYVETYSNQLQYQDSTNAIVFVGTNTKDYDDYRTIIGLHPLCSTAGRQVVVDCVADHPEMKKGEDRILIPEPFDTGVSNFAIAKALQKEKAFEEAKFYLEAFSDYCDKAREYMAQAHRRGHAEVKVVDAEMPTFWWNDRVILP